jgi:hypothetical protein
MPTGRYQWHCLHYTPFLEFLEGWSFRKKPNQGDSSKNQEIIPHSFFCLSSVGVRERYFAMNHQHHLQSFLAEVND